MSMLDIPFIDTAIPSADCSRAPEDCEKVKGVQAQVEAVKKQLEETHKKIDCIESKLDANNKALDENTAKTNEIFEIVQMGKGFFRGLSWIGKWLRKIVMFLGPPITVVVGLFTALIGLWYALTNKTP